MYQRSTVNATLLGSFLGGNMEWENKQVYAYNSVPVLTAAVPWSAPSLKAKAGMACPCWTSLPHAGWQHLASLLAGSGTPRRESTRPPCIAPRPSLWAKPGAHAEARDTRPVPQEWCPISGRWMHPPCCHPLTLRLHSQKTQGRLRRLQQAERDDRWAG